MRRLTNNHSLRCVVVLLLLTTLLTFSVGRVKRVEAVATTAAIAGAALLGTGAIYLGYLAMTGGTVSIPNGTGADIQDYLKNVGQKVAYYASGAAIYNKIYSYLRGNGVSALNNYDVTWSQSDLKDMYNDFKDISLIKSLTNYYLPADSYEPTTNFDYPYTFLNYSTDFINGIAITPSMTLNMYTGHAFISVVGEYAYVGHIYQSTYSWRNKKNLNGTYTAQELLSSNVWSDLTNISCNIGSYRASSTDYGHPVYVRITDGVASLTTTSQPNVSLSNLTYPPLPYSDIYDEATGETIPPIVLQGEVVDNVDYSDNDEYPVVPYVQLPSGGNWGFNLGDLITEIINRSAQTITAVGIGDLINQFRNALGSSSGDYIYYSDNDNEYYIYYSNVYQGDEYITYSIDISDEQDVIPVDLNTISRYTDNDYLDIVKQSAVDYGNTIGQWFVFWHNSDPALLYTLLGSAIVILLGMFIGKWGHS